MNLSAEKATELLLQFLVLFILGISCKQSVSDKNEDPKVAELVLPPGFKANRV